MHTSNFFLLHHDLLSNITGNTPVRRQLEHGLEIRRFQSQRRPFFRHGCRGRDAIPVKTAVMGARRRGMFGRGLFGKPRPGGSALLFRRIPTGEKQLGRQGADKERRPLADMRRSVVVPGVKVFGGKDFAPRRLAVESMQCGFGSDDRWWGGVDDHGSIVGETRAGADFRVGNENGSTDGYHGRGGQCRRRTRNGQGKTPLVRIVAPVLSSGRQSFFVGQHGGGMAATTTTTTGGGGRIQWRRRGGRVVAGVGPGDDGHLRFRSRWAARYTIGGISRRTIDRNVVAGPRNSGSRLRQGAPARVVRW
jgi:hypothetical protein